MKKILFGLCAVIFALSSYGKTISEKKVPVLVKHAFYLDNPAAEHVKWGITAENDYMVSFREGNNYGTAYYDENGQFVESDITVEWKEVPLTGRMEIYHLNEKGHISDVLKVTNQKHQDFYLIFVKNKLKHYEILLDKEGNLIKTTN